MKQIEFHLSKDCDLSGTEKLIEKICARRGLHIGMKGSLAGFPGCVHWHFKKPSHKGTLEITLYRKERRIWAQVQEGRRAPWIATELPLLQGEIEKKLRHG